MVRIGIIGGGPAGMASAIWSHRLGVESFILERHADLGGQLNQFSSPIVDLPGFGPDPPWVLVDHLRRELDRLGIPVFFGAHVRGWTDGCLMTGDGRSFEADRVIYAPGLKARRLHIPGEEWAFPGSAAELAQRAQTPQNIMVVGSGDRGVEAALRLCRHGHHVTLVSRSPIPSAREPFRRELSHSQVAVLANASVTAIARCGDGVSVRLTGGLPPWTGAEILIRVGMEPDVESDLATCRHDLAYATSPAIAIVGDASVESWERSLITAHASAMRAVKRCVLGVS